MYDHSLTISNFHFLLIHHFPYYLRNLSKGVKILIASHPTQGNQSKILSDLEKLRTSRLGSASKKPSNSWNRQLVVEPTNPIEKYHFLSNLDHFPKYIGATINIFELPPPSCFDGPKKKELPSLNLLVLRSEIGEAKMEPCTVYLRNVYQKSIKCR